MGLDKAGDTPESQYHRIDLALRCMVETLSIVSESTCDRLGAVDCCEPVV